MKTPAALLRGVIFSSIILLYACSESDPEIDPGVAPDIPPVSTFVMDFNITEADGGRAMTKNNWTYSALNVGFWNIAITTTFAIPVASFAESFNHEPVFDASIPGWVWEYDYAALGAKYTAKLQATVNSTEVAWDMFITRENGFEDFNWYSGVSKLDGLSGSWVLNHDPNDPSPFIEIKWARSETDELASIGYTNVVSGADTNGDFIFFERDESDDFNRQYDIYDKSEANTTEIRWNSVSKDGKVRDFLYFQDNSFHCWDSMLDDIDCP
ncbi:MAG: hypothetical protein RIM99_19815 [Cyclobacteriaceae bacterium]